MTNLAKNKKPFYYLNYISNEEYESGGKYTGEKIVKYTKPKLFMGHISGATGSSQVEIFGTDIKYDKTILLTNYECDEIKIDENSVFFIDKKPSYDGETPLYNYRVKKIARSINQVHIAIEKVGN